MDNKTFDELIKTGELSLILMDGGADLTPKQMAKVKSTAKALSDERLQKMAAELAASPGYQEMMMAPIMSELMKMGSGKSDKKPFVKSNKKDDDTKEQTAKLKEKTVNNKDANFTTTVPNSENPLKIGDSSSDILGKIYNLMIKKYHYDKEIEKYQTKTNNKDVETKIKQNQELIDLFEVSPAKIKAKVRKGKKTEPKKETPEKKSQTKTETPAPKTKAPTAERVPSTTSVSNVARNIVVAAVGGGTLFGMKNAIAGAESGGNYNITYGDTLDKKGNIRRGPNLSPEQKFGKDLTELTLEEIDTLGKERNRASASTSAMGKYQFMNSTLFGSRDKKGVFRPGLVQQLGLDPKTTKFTPEVQDKLYNLLHEQDTAQLKRKGVPITPGYEYMAHYLGATGAAAVYERRNSNMTVQQALVDAGLRDPVSGKTNEELSRIKASEFESILNSRLTKQGLNSPHASRKEDLPVPKNTPVPATVEIPSKLPTNNGTKTAPNVIQQNNNTNIYNSSPTYAAGDDNSPNKPALVEKQYN